ncbi:MAG: ABC transporter permease subunit [Ktedonobacteraceae bacterium]|nr:ABC transporter permease subunit [Ktedonobacteraceae bacterium]
MSSSVPEAIGKVPMPERSPNVILGKQDFMSVLLRSIGGELYKIRRRPLAKALLLIGIAIMILGFGVFALPAIINSSLPVESYLPPPCKGSASSIQSQCLNHTPNAEDLAKAAQVKTLEVKAASTPLYLPDSFFTAISIIYFIGVMLIIILAGTIVGGEYISGSIRVMLTRGPTRTQFLLAKVGTMLIYSAFLLVLLAFVGILTGAILTLLTNASVDWKFLTSAWLLHCLLFLLLAILGLFVYGTLAICFSTLGKATVGGVAGGLIWWFMERVLSSILPFLGLSNKSAFGNFLSAVPDYFIGNNIGALLNNQEQYMNGGQATGSISDLHAIIVLLVYLAVFIGSAWWVNQARDISN